jgi:hypothetical protein
MNPIVYNGMQGLGGGDAMARFTIRGQVYEYHMSKYDADKVQWLKTKSVGKALNLAKKRAYKTVKASAAIQLTASAKYDHINFSPPAGASSAAKKALKWKDEHGDAVKGGTAVGWTRARQLADGGEMSVETVKRMYKFFQRHEKNKAINPEFKGEPWRDNGYVAWLIWGGDAGKSWAEKLWDQMEAADAKTAKDGLWDNVRKKRERGGKPARPGDEGTVSAKKRAYKTVKASSDRFLKMAYEFGQRTSKQTYTEIAYGEEGELFTEVHDDDWGSIFFEEGRDYPSKPFPNKTVGWRYGNPPKLKSWNSREDEAERGVSVMQIKGGKKLRGLYEIFNGKNKPIVFIKGYLLHSTGGDDESLIADAKVVREPSGSWDYPIKTARDLISTQAQDELRELMIETSRRVARLASEVILADRKKFNLQSKYNYWNNKLFGGELPRVPLKWNRSRTFGGAVYKSYVGDLILINKLVISDFLQMDEQRFDAILIHEMIHVWQGANGIREGSGGHGREFHRMAKALGSKAGFTIPLTEDISDMSVNDNIKSKEFVVVLFEGRGNPGHQLFNVSNWNRNKAQFTNDLQRIARMYNREFTVVLSSDRELMKMRTKNGVLGKRGNMSWSVSDAGFAKRIESEGRVLAKIKEKKFDASKPSKMLMGIGRYVATKLEDRYPSVDFKPEVEVAKLGEKDVVIMTVKSNRGRGELAIRAFFGETEIPRVTVHFKTQMNEMLWDRAGKYPTPKAVIDALDSKIKRSEQEAEFGAFKL